MDEFHAGVLRGLVALALIGALAAGADARAGTKWDPVPPEQMAQARGLVDPDADAEILHWKVSVEDWYGETGLVSDRRYRVRVKVFTRSGAQRWSQIQILQPARSRVKLSDLEARTVLPDGTVRDIAPGAFSEETIVRRRNSRWVRVACALSGVEPGAIVEYRYHERWTGELAWAGHYPLQLDHPAQEIVYSIKPLAETRWPFRTLLLHATNVPERGRSRGLEVIRVTNQPAFRAEPDMPPREQQLPFALGFYAAPGDFTPEGYWPRVGRRHALAFEEATRPNDEIRRTAAEEVKGATTDALRVERIARWLRGHFRVVGPDSPDSGKSSRLRPAGSAAEALRKGGGDHADVLYLFASLLRAAGMDPRWVLVASRQDFFFHRIMTMEGFLDSRQVALWLDGGWRTFDPATEHLPWDMLEWDTEGVSALLCDRDSARFIVTSQSPPERSTLSHRADLELRPDGSLAGSMHLVAEGHSNARTRALLEGLRAAELDSAVTRMEDAEGVAWRVSGARLLNADEPREPLRLSASVELAAYAAVTGKRMLFEPCVFRARARPRYTSSAREHPVYYEHAWCDVDTVRVRLPEGWVIEDFDPISPVFAEGVADYVADVRVSGDGRELTYVRRFRMGIDGSIYIPAEYYPGVKQLFDGVRTRDGVVLSLKRIGGAP